jgi:hypothetical protein
MCFQRPVEIDDESEHDSIPEPPQRPTAILSTGRNKKPKEPVSTPAHYQPVRLMSTLRLREQRAKEDRDRAYAKRLEEDLRKAGLDQAQTDVVLNGEADIESNQPNSTECPGGLSQSRLSTDTILVMSLIRYD